MRTTFRSWILALGILLVAGVPACGGGDDDDGGDDDGDDAPSTGERADGAQQLTIDRDGSLQNPAWSPDSDAVLFTRFRDGYNAEPADLFVVELPDGEPRTLVQDGSGNVNLPGSSWNAETGAIVFSSSRDPHDEIYSVDDFGEPGDESPVTQRDDFVAYEPTLSPDGAWIVFESHRLDEEDYGVITKYAVDGSSDYEALTASDDDCRQPNWSPTGDLILYQRYDGDQWEIWVMSPEGSDVRQVTDGPGDKTDASFSPDGEWIVYSSDEGELDLANLFAIPVAGGESVRITEWDGYDGAPAWSPDGSQIAFESFGGDPDDSPGTTLWLVDAPTL